MEKLLTVDKLAGLLEVKKSTIYQWTHLGLIPHLKLRRFLRFRERDIEKRLVTKQIKPRERLRPRI